MLLDQMELEEMNLKLLLKKDLDLNQVMLSLTLNLLETNLFVQPLKLNILKLNLCKKPLLDLQLCILLEVL